MENILVVCGALVVDGNRLVLVQEAQKRAYGKWNFPAGILESGEDIFASAKREIKEETDLDVRLDGLLGVYQSVGKDINVVKFIFKASVTGGKLKHQEGELLDAKWFTFEEFSKLDDEKLRTTELRRAVEDYKSGRLLPLEAIRLDIRG